MKIVFATNNPNKLQEIRDILGERFEIVSLQDIGCHEDIPETGETLQENALLKAKYVAEHYGLDCFADDTGLEVEALHGAPGVHSARYAEGTDHNSEANMQKLLHELLDKENRNARFRTVIALLQHHKNQQEKNVENTFAAPEIHYFEGRIDGIIAKEKRGNAGFGYDPLFIPNGYQQSFAELGETIKNHISHRAQAVEKLAEYLHSKINETS
ncbi:non-canonical purine NTP pyrophosphatase [Hoylesella timonensis]|uniref:dITP/XTP pyrophosphatase n=1 Tax=Hoylesella timonensis TaxID=386414 RepID=A0A2K0XCW4_9BACT|nr:non-canonical purine NTP diphosphatase [Hoylesella timonensis]PNP92386.1 non-canonical purine NTP pyrophosphatase [Hoylesella timonensis]